MIYITPFDMDTKVCTAPSSPAGFDTLAEAIEALGPPLRYSGQRTAIYDGVAVTDYPLLTNPSGKSYSAQD